MYLASGEGRRGKPTAKVGLGVHPLQGQAGVLQGVQGSGHRAEIQGVTGERYKGKSLPLTILKQYVASGHEKS